MFSKNKLKKKNNKLMFTLYYNLSSVRDILVLVNSIYIYL